MAGGLIHMTFCVMCHLGITVWITLSSFFFMTKCVQSPSWNDCGIICVIPYWGCASAFQSSNTTVSQYVVLLAYYFDLSLNKAQNLSLGISGLRLSTSCFVWLVPVLRHVAPCYSGLCLAWAIMTGLVWCGICNFNKCLLLSHSLSWWARMKDTLKRFSIDFLKKCIIAEIYGMDIIFEQNLQ